MTNQPWTHDPDIERTRRALADDSPLLRGLQQTVLRDTSSAGAERREAISDYEQRLRAHVATGGQVPPGVLPPSAADPELGNKALVRSLVDHLRTPAPKPPEATWKPDPRVEQVRRYAQSADERERAVAGQFRDAILRYEADLRQWLAEGNALPTGVIAPPRAESATSIGSYRADLRYGA